jgi:transcriptional regulator with PAS, ATPase and Fis domain
MEEKQPWITCYITDMLLSYVRETLHSADKIDYGALFRGVEGFETPADPKSFLADVKNWIPLSVLRELEFQCENISGEKDITYHAAKAYFTPGRKQLPSLFEVIIQVLNDVRSALLFANMWGASQTNYLKLQTFEKTENDNVLYMLAQFDQNAGPSIGAINLLKGFCEGFPRIYPFIEEVSCVEEISQLRLDDILRDFPLLTVTRQNDSVSIQDRSSEKPLVKATRVCLKTESVALPPDFLQTPPDAVVVNPQNGHIEVLTSEVTSAPPRKVPASLFAYRITTPGVISHGPLAYAFRKGQIFEAPYCRFRVVIKERPVSQQETSVQYLRKEVSKLLFEQLRQSKQTHTRMIQMSVEKTKLALENIRLRREVQREYSFAGLIGQSKDMQELFGIIRSIAETDITVLIQGETGTGKELIARAIHYNGPRKNQRFVAINCGALSLTLLESELFGHERGAFTGAIGQKKGIFEIANGGTLFLDEIGEISPGTQVKLLRVLQEGEVQRVGGTDTTKVDVRIIAATNQNLEDLIEKSGFRRDLFYRLNVFPVQVTPLRQRIDDIPLLVTHFIEKFSKLSKKTINDVTPQALALLMAYHWPGNVRELENTIQRMMVICKGDSLDVQDAPPHLRGNETASNRQTKDLKDISRESTELIEKRSIRDALAKTGGNVTHAAKALGISRATLQNKMKLYGLREVKA